MLRVRKHVDRLHRHHFVSRVQQLQVTGLGGWVAADVDDFLGADLQQLLHYLLGHARTGRVGDDEVGATVALDEVVGEHLGHVASIECAVGDAVEFGVHLGVVDGGLHVFDADYFLHEAREILGDGARARVEVVHQLVALHLGEVEGGLVESLGLVDVGLEERHRTDAELEVVIARSRRFHGLDEVRLSLETLKRQVVDDVVELRVDDQEQRHDLREGHLQGGHQLVAHHLVLLADDEDDHELALRVAADDEVAQQSLMGTEVVVGEMTLQREPPDKQSDVVRRVGLKVALFDVDHTVEELGQVEAQAFAGFFVVRTWGAIGEPFAVREGVFQLVAIEKLLLASQNRAYLWILDLADAVEVILHLFLFVVGLPLVVHVLPFAAAAEAEVLAHRLHALV